MAIPIGSQCRHVEPGGGQFSNPGQHSYPHPWPPSDMWPGAHGLLKQPQWRPQELVACLLGLLKQGEAATAAYTPLALQELGLAVEPGEQRVAPGGFPRFYFEIGRRTALCSTSCRVHGDAIGAVWQRIRAG